LSNPEVLQDLEEAFCANISLTLLASWGLDAELQEVARSRHDWSRTHRGRADLADVVMLVNLHELRLENDPTRYLPEMRSLPAYEKVDPGPVSERGTLAVLDESVGHRRDRGDHDGLSPFCPPPQLLSCRGDERGF
jgi:hypothetical protein